MTISKLDREEERREREREREKDSEQQRMIYSQGSVVNLPHPYRHINDQCTSS